MKSVRKRALTTVLTPSNGPSALQFTDAEISSIDVKSFWIKYPPDPAQQVDMLFMFRIGDCTEERFIPPKFHRHLQAGKHAARPCKVTPSRMDAPPDFAQARSGAANRRRNRIHR